MTPGHGNAQEIVLNRGRLPIQQNGDRRIVDIDHRLPLVGLRAECQRLVSALQKRQRLLILGPAGSGKSALIAHSVAGLESHQDIITIPYSANLHHLLIDLSRILLRTDHSAFLKLARLGDDPERWLSQQTSVHLRGLLWTALETEPRVIILDGISSAGFPTYRFLQRLSFAKGVGLIASARDPISLGALSRLFWDPRNTMLIPPLNDSEAKQLFDMAIRHFDLNHLEIEEFRVKAIGAAQGNPGQLIEMCKLAANPIYISGTHIKFAPLRIDALMKFI